MTSHETAGALLLCPSCQQQGKKVKPRTVYALLKPEYRQEVVGYDPSEEDACGCKPAHGNTGYRFCDSPTCEVVYFSETSGQVFNKSQLRVPVGVKETSGERPLCYCFGYSVANIKEELRTQGRSDALADIRQKMKDPGCRCETENPSGSCCLGSVAKGITTAQEELGMNEEQDTNTSPPRIPSPSKRGETIALIGTVLSAIIASSCCWLPLLLLAVGVSVAGIASTLEAYRPVFMVVTFGFLAAAFYFTYRPKQTAAGGGHACCATEKVDACCSSAAKGRLNLMAMNKVMLWVVTIMAVAFLLFPSYVGAFLGGDRSTVTANMNRSIFTIEGMTCEGCSATVAKAIRGVPGVLAVHVSYEEGQAVVGTEACCPVPEKKILTALKSAGYRGKRLEDAKQTAPSPKDY